MNILRTAAQNQNVTEASKIVRDALGIVGDNIALEILPASHRWRQFSVEGRLNALAAWLRAECFEQMDLVQAVDPLHSVGTRD